MSVYIMGTFGRHRTGNEVDFYSMTSISVI